MTKLEQKLVELGYEQNGVHKHLYLKDIGKARILLWLNLSHTNITKDSGVLNHKSIYVRSQQEIDTLQIAFKEFEKDLEELKQCQD